MRPVVLHSIIKQRASQLQKEKDLKWLQALDAASREFDYTNYKNYKNLLEAKRKQSKYSTDFLMKKISSESDVSKKIALAIPLFETPKTQFQDLFDILKLFKFSADSIQSLCEKSILKSEIQSYLFNDFRSPEGKAEIQSWQTYFIAKEISIRDLIFKLEDDILFVEGNYDLKTEFEFEIDRTDPISHDERFNDRELFGSFDITIDRNKSITIENSDIGEKFNGFYQSASFR